MSRALVLVAFLLSGVQPAAALPSNTRDAVPDSIRAQLEAGRFWKASLALRAHLDPLSRASLADRVLLAEAEAGWKNWPGVVEVLELGAPEEDDDGGPYWYLLGIAKEQLDDPAAGRAALERYLMEEDPTDPAALVARSRLLRTPVLAAEGPDALPVILSGLRELRVGSPVLADWTALELAEELSEAGHPEETARVLDLVVGAESGRTSWSWVADAWAVRGDTAEALRVLDGVDLTGSTAPPAATLLGKILPFRLAVGDTAGASATAGDLLQLTTRGSAALQAARLLLESGTPLDGEGYTRVALALGRGGDDDRALSAWAHAIDAGVALTGRHRLSRAGSLASTGQRPEAVDEYRSLAASDEAETAVPALVALIRQSRGQRGAIRELEDELIRRFPEREEALRIAYLRADDLQDAGRLDEAIAGYAGVIEMSGAANLAGLSRMRWGHIHLSRGEFSEAARVFEDYLTEFPNGRRWDEASYWGAWAAQQGGEAERARELASRLLEAGPITYYAVLAEGLDLGVPVPVLEDGPPVPRPGWLGAELAVLELLQSAGLERGIEAQVATLKEATWDSDDVLLRLASELNVRGRTMDGINLGWELRRRGRSWDKTLLRIVYPFPYRDMVMSFAEERGLDPYLLAGLIRQESAFVPDIVSHAGAVGLMQVMPATGQELARAVGPSAFRRDALTTPEVNMHLGTRFLSDLLRRYPELPLVLSAYNAGPTRANRWRRFPEAADPARFTERIPFAETRGYVKNVTRNRALYRFLYGDSDPAAADR